MKDKAQLIVDEIEADKTAAESKLEAAKPALEAAEAALQVTHMLSICGYTSQEYSAEHVASVDGSSGSSGSK